MSPVIPAAGRRLIALLAAAYVGVFVSFVPFVTLMLPLKAEAIAPDERVVLLGAAGIWGAVVAGLSNIGFGMASDRAKRRGRGRKPVIAAGLPILTAGYALFALAADVPALMLAVAVVQVGINALLAPLTALLADEVPDAWKGRVLGLLGAAQPTASLMALLVATAPDAAARSLLVVAGVTVLVLPFLLAGRPVDGAGHALPPAAVQDGRRRDFVRVWAARLIVQVAASLLSTYGLFHFGRIGRLDGDAALLPTATVIAVAALAATAATVVAGARSDRIGRRRPLMLSAAALAAGMATLALAGDWTLAAGGYVLATTGLSIFLALSNALSMQLLPSPDHRGRDMGVVNLANVLPAVISPALAWTLAADGDFTAPFLLLALLALGAGALAMRVRRAR